MKRNSFSFLLPLIGLVVVIFSCKNEDDPFEYLQYVNPFIGTAYTGHTFPNATCPFGMVQPGPQTGNFAWEYCSGYNYEDSLMWGFSQTRLNGTGIPDSGDILMMPFAGQCRENYKSFFDKKTEVAYPGYYAVDLVDNQVKVELTCTPHVAMHRYLFNEENPGLYIDFQSGCVSSEQQYDNRVIYADIKTPDHYTITGEMQVRHWVERRLFFVIKFDKPFISEERKLVKESHRAPSCVYRFETNGKKQSQLLVKVGISTVSIEGAEENLRSELDHWNFDQVKLEAGKKWENYLSRVQIKGTTDQKVSFYTSMYHLMIQPNNIADVDGQYRNSEDSVSISPFGKYYSTFSLWDTYRAAHPLYTILTPELVSDMVNTMLLHANAHGFLPIWALWGKENHCMIGNHGIPPVVEACLKGFPGIDQEQAYAEVKKSLLIPHHKSEWNIYDKYGYFPFDIISEESVSRTLVNCYDDYCAAQLAAKLGKTEDYNFFIKRSGYWKNLFDEENKLVRGKDSDGRWRTPFDRFALSHAGTAGGDYTEGNAWQYTWHVQHDVEELINRVGGNEAFVTKLDSLFFLDHTAEVKGFVGDVTGLIGQYSQGNEPSHHIMYLYRLAGKKGSTEALVRDVFERFYQPYPDGLCGNDDCGQMSAWYIFSAMGFYPVNPVSGEYILGAPQVLEINIKLSDDKTFTVRADKLSDKNKYVKSIKFNDKEVNENFITYQQIMNGGMLVFEMTDRE